VADDSTIRSAQTCQQRQSRRHAYRIGVIRHTGPAAFLARIAVMLFSRPCRGVVSLPGFSGEGPDRERGEVMVGAASRAGLLPVSSSVG